MTAAPDLYAIRRDHGGSVYDGGRRWIGPGPGHGRRDKSLSAYDAGGGLILVHSFAGDPLRACLDHLGIERGAAERMDDGTMRRLRAERDARDRQDRARKLRFCGEVWSQAVPAEGSPVAVYLRETRRLTVSMIPGSLRFHPAAPLSYPWSEGADAGATCPAMVALVANAKAEGAGLHVTPLQAEGRRAARNKLMFGSCNGGAVWMGAPGHSLGVCEGIETALAFGQLFDLTTWAALSSSIMQSFTVPPGVRELQIGADSDDGGAGIAAAERLAERARRTCNVTIRPAPAGKDWADALAEAS